MAALRRDGARSARGNSKVAKYGGTEGCWVLAVRACEAFVMIGMDEVRLLHFPKLLSQDEDPLLPDPRQAESAE